MFRWYKEAKVCYAYLDDVPGTTSWNLFTGDSPLAKCRWFTRGWTLQELLAPKKLCFFASDWTLLGWKHDAGVAESIKTITGIGQHYLLGTDIRKASVARRMCWASKRNTTREEDIAYCLLGIFDVNMPLLYGEGHKAFERLQEQIMKSSVDHSLFAWGVHELGVGESAAQATTKESHMDRGHVSMFANSPAAFANSDSIIPYRSFAPTPYTLTNRGIEMQLAIGFPSEWNRELTLPRPFYAVLFCHVIGDMLCDIAIPVERRSTNEYLRKSGEWPLSVAVLDLQSTQSSSPLRNSLQTVFLNVSSTLLPIYNLRSPEDGSLLVFRQLPRKDGNYWVDFIRPDFLPETEDQVVSDTAWHRGCKIIMITARHNRQTVLDFAFLLRSKSDSDANLLVGCKDKSTIKEVEDISRLGWRRQPYCFTRLVDEIQIRRVRESQTPRPYKE
jgi:hypothetical protein